ncbi:12610_t:CDS:1 [Funneliformis mosseae]|uniref:12610_t:CDS:1 n=1 Tax=Funneliformis mosseae TaxID=27381 RepID=A0A9N8VFN8_FUNMO|nr:12610_t:CDS:1 [Funneliformis mosseae]
MEISEIPVQKIFKSIILDSLMKDEFIRKRQSTENFFSRNEYLLTGAAIVAGAALGPLAVTGLVAALGFGEAGIVADKLKFSTTSAKRSNIFFTLGLLSVFSRYS